MPRLQTTFLGCLVVVLGASAIHAETVDLRPKFEKGRETFYRCTMGVDRNMETANGQRMNMRIDIEFGMSLKVIDVLVDKNAKLHLTLQYLKIKSDMPPMGFDTRDEASLASSPMGNMLTGYVKTPVTLTVSPTGDIETIEGFEKIEAAKGPAGGLMENIFSEEVAKHLPLFPAAKAGKNPTPTGHKWSEEYDRALPAGMGTLHTAVDYELAKLDSATRGAQIPYTYRISLKERDPASSQPASMVILDNLAGNATGTMHWDVAAGECREVRGEETAQMDVAMAGNPSMKQKIETRTTSLMERVDKEAMKLEKTVTQPAPDTTGSTTKPAAQ